MNPSTLRILFVVFLLAHGWMHYSLATVPLPEPGKLHTPFWPSWWRANTDPTWPASRLGLPMSVVRTGGWLLWAAVVGAYTLAALALLFFPGTPAVWQTLTAAASVLSVVTIGLYWHPWFPVGAGLSLALLVGLYLRWPAALFPALGA